MKPLARAKQRLSDVLTPEQRRSLSLAMLRDVVAAARGLDAAWVICSDDEAVEVAEEAGARPVPDPTPEDGLNASLAGVTELAIREGAEGMLILSADCPAATIEDVRALALGPGVALCPDRTSTGTNALWRQPCDLIPTWFGRMSRRAHQGLAYANHLPFARVPLDRVALDVDRARDLDELGRIGAGPATTDVLHALGYPRRLGR